MLIKAIKWYLPCIYHGKNQSNSMLCLKITIELNSSAAQVHVCLQVDHNRVQGKEWQEHFIHDLRYVCYSHCPPGTTKSYRFWIVFLLGKTTRLHCANWWILSSLVSSWMQTTLMDVFSEIKYFVGWQLGQKWTRARGTKCDKNIYFFRYFQYAGKNAPVVFICHLTFDRFNFIFGLSRIIRQLCRQPSTL